MKEITLRTSVIKAAAKADGITPAEFVSRIRSISLGRKVCAHLKMTDGEYSVFICE